MLTPKERIEVENAVKNYNSSPWNDFDQMNLEEVLCIAEDDGAEQVIYDIRRCDIRNFHKEEAECGNI